MTWGGGGGGGSESLTVVVTGEAIHYRNFLHQN